MKSDNPYLPAPVTIDKVIEENEARDLRTFRLVFCDDEDRAAFKHECGQFAMISVPGKGESPIGIASSPLDDAYVELTVKRYGTGLVTPALHRLEPGARVGLRGPYGNAYPLDQLEGKKTLIISGGFAFTTLRATIRYMLHPDNRSRYGDITVIYGARTPGELLYKQELEEWGARKDVEVHLTVDRADEGWKGREDLVPKVVEDVVASSADTVALVCGPPIMLKFTMIPLLAKGFEHESIITSLERRMSCGVGKCGKCYIGNKCVCKDGPVFNYSQLQDQKENAL